MQTPAVVRELAAFPCTRCGACCWLLATEGTVPLRADSACAFLSDDNRACTIYADRPELCRVDSMMDGMGLSREAIYARQAVFCNRLQEALRLPESFRVNL